MYNTWQRFLTIAFGSLFAFIVFVNLLGWSGVYIDLANGSVGAFEGKYFSLMSIINFLRSGKAFTDGMTWSVNQGNDTYTISFNEIIKPSFLVNAISVLIRSGTLGIPNLIQEIASFSAGKSDVFNLLKSILDFILLIAFFPLGALYGSLCLFIYVIAYIFWFISAGLVFFAGGYNVNFMGDIVNSSIYSEYESIMDEYGWSSIVDNWESIWPVVY